VAIKAIKGINDILPDVVGKWQLVESVARRIFSNFGFQEIRIPILENLPEASGRPLILSKRRCTHSPTVTVNSSP